MAADLEALVARLSSGLDTSSSPEARLHLLADVLQEAGPDLRLPFFSALPSDVSSLLEHDYVGLSRKVFEEVSLLQRVDAVIKPPKNQAASAAVGKLDELCTVNYVNSRLGGIHVYSDSNVAREIKTTFFAPLKIGLDQVLYDKTEVDSFFSKAKGYSFIDYRTLNNLLSITHHPLFDSLRRLAGEPDKPVVMIGNGKGFDVYFKKGGLTLEQLARRIQTYSASLMSEAVAKPAARMVPGPAQQARDYAPPPGPVPVFTPKVLTKEGIAATYNLSALTVDRVMAGLGMSNLEESSCSALVGFLDEHYILEDKLSLRRTSGMTLNQLLEKLGKLSWKDRSLTQLIGMRQLGFVHAYQKGDERRLVDVLLAPLTPFLPKDNLYEVLAAENVSRYEVSYLFGLHNSEGGANASLERWAQSGELVPSSSGTYNGMQLVGLALNKRRSLFFASLGYTGKQNDDILLSAEKDFDGYVPKPAVGSLAQLPY